MSSQKIAPHLWLKNNAGEVAQFYTSVFPNSKVISKTAMRDRSYGDYDSVAFSIMGYEVRALSPIRDGIAINPSISLMVNFDPSQDERARERIDEVWEKLSPGGKVLMPIGSYPFSERFGWIEDKYGFSWQLIYTEPEGDERPLIIPAFLFVGDLCGKAEEASEYYLSLFRGAKRGAVARFPAGSEPEREGTTMFADFTLEGQWFAVMDSAQYSGFGFNDAVSFIIGCGNQREIDYYWDRLLATPGSGQCGWLKDKYGVSWQIVPENMDDLMSKNRDATTKAMLAMKKIVIADLERAGQE